MRKFLLLLMFIVNIHKANSQLTVAEWNFPGSASSIANSYSITPNNSGKTIVTVGGTGPINCVANSGAYSKSASCTGWDAGSGIKCWEIEFNTTGLYNLDVSSKQRSSTTGPKDWKVQYKIGMAGFYTDLPGATNIIVADDFTTVTGQVNQVALPASCQNQPSIYLRWIMTSNTSVSLGAITAAANTYIDEIVVNSNATGFFRTAGSGSWKNKAVWQYSTDNINWVPADTTPTYAAKTITIRAGNTVNIDTTNYFNSNSNLRIDEVVIDAGGQLNMRYSHLIINNGIGVDITVNGTWEDDFPLSITHYLTTTWNLGVTWQLGANATFIKTADSPALPYQSNYNAGVPAIPATATWILRKINPLYTPTMTSGSMFYPNLILQNMSASTYNTTAAGTYFNAGNTCTIKGDFTIASTSALNSITMNDSIYGNSLIVMGKLIINQFGTLTIKGDSVHLNSDVIVNGTLNHTGILRRKVIFSTSTAQTIKTGIGAINIWNCEIRKPLNDVTLNMNVTIDGNLNLVRGRFFSANTPNGLMIINANANVTSVSNLSFVHGPCRKIGNTAFTFPVGKSNLYRQCSIGAGGVGGTINFWSEDFNNGCSQLCQASGYSGPNGAWAVTSTSPASDCGLPVTPNRFYVSCAENGNLSGTCSSGCGGDATLHVGNDPNSTNAPFLCPTGDCGAIYDAGGDCGDLGGAGGGTSSKTDIRAESPIINCSAKAGITLSFRYFEQGTGTLDNATLWYFDGVTWTQIADLPKTGFCGLGLPIWTVYSALLPASADNNPNVKIGFKWVNDDSGIGAADASFAVDSVRLMVTITNDVFTAEYKAVNPQILAPCLNNRAPGLTAISCSEYWQIDRQAGSTPRSVTLSWINPSPSCNVNIVPDLVVARCDGSSMWENRGNGGTTGVLAAGTVTSAGGINNFSPFTIGTITYPLPVTLLNFDARMNVDKVDITWLTAEEINIEKFVVQHSNNNLEFEDIAETKPYGPGFYYKVVDAKPFSGINYYRLKMIDRDAKVYYSSVKSVSNFKNAEMISSTFYTDNLVIFNISETLKNISSTICIYDQLGKKIYCNTLFLESSNSLPAYLKPGIYMLVIENEVARTSQKFIVK